MRHWTTPDAPPSSRTCCSGWSMLRLLSRNAASTLLAAWRRSAHSGISSEDEPMETEVRARRLGELRREDAREALGDRYFTTSRFTAVVLGLPGDQSSVVDVE